MELNVLYNYAVLTLRPQNTEIGQPELNNSGEKYQDKNELILHNPIINAILNQINDMIQGFVPFLQYVLKISLGKISTLSLS